MTPPQKKKQRCPLTTTTALTGNKIARNGERGDPPFVSARWPSNSGEHARGGSCQCEARSGGRKHEPKDAQNGSPARSRAPGKSPRPPRPAAPARRSIGLRGRVRLGRAGSGWPCGAASPGLAGLTGPSAPSHVGNGQGGDRADKACVCVCMCARVCTCVHVCVHECARVRVCVHTCARACVLLNVSSSLSSLAA